MNQMNLTPIDWHQIANDKIKYKEYKVVKLNWKLDNTGLYQKTIKKIKKKIAWCDLHIVRLNGTTILKNGEISQDVHPEHRNLTNKLFNPKIPQKELDASMQQTYRTIMKTSPLESQATFYLVEKRIENSELKW